MGSNFISDMDFYKNRDVRESELDLHVSLQIIIHT